MREGAAGGVRHNCQWSKEWVGDNPVLECLQCSHQVYANDRLLGLRRAAIAQYQQKWDDL